MIIKKPVKILEVIFVLLLLIITLPVFSVKADIKVSSELCESIEQIDQECESLSKEECHSLLQDCQKYLQEKSEEINENINQTQREKQNLQDQIYYLNNRIGSLDSQIRQSNVMIRDISMQVEDTTESIDKTTERIDNSKQRLSKILRRIYEQDQKTSIEIIMAGDDLSDFFDNLMNLQTLNERNKTILQEIKSLKNRLEKQKYSLTNEKDDLEKTVVMKEVQKQERSEMKKNQEYYLQLTQAEYQQYLEEKKETEKKAQTIRERIFELAGVSEAPTFEEAYNIAKQVEGITGIRPAFLLAVLQQESAIGKNVGQCYLKDPQTGAGIVASTGRKINNVMKPSRDVQPFLTITKALGRDPYSTPVSCPLNIGYGGAMGPAQFIPSTWNMYRGKLKEITGEPGDPWSIKDAFLASALYLTESGANSQTRNGEWRAAMIYFSGSTNNPAFYWYANQVLNKADSIEKDIELIK